MDSQQTPLLERAYEIARSSQCNSMDNLRAMLKGEGHSTRAIEAHLGGRAIKADLRALLKKG
jgi:hypothetical protein